MDSQMEATVRNENEMDSQMEGVTADARDHLFGQEHPRLLKKERLGGSNGMLVTFHLQQRG
ncbi:hypothetical protein EJ110_NYTH27596 [Nymphaea thermarum]|nr:hypothetical protein EJ110_NYTH27596 [Nymphaea thermarum]